ncbi:MAG TPA: protein-glutamate O-methyltransferase CheR [Mobilitalea sp.]|nr:protein-glutamate O-methyltransferase CheR [Mobilitalea sp.]
MITITKNEFGQLTAFIKANYGIHLKAEKEALVIGRLQNVLVQKGFKSFSEYYDYILEDKSGIAVSTLLDKITTNHTFFMREADHFQYFKEVVLPYFADMITDKDFRLWCAGCSSGEEPYTLAMIIDEFFGKDKLKWDAKILATDISSRVLEEAKNGIYNNKELDTLPSKWKLSYLNKIDSETSVFHDKIKNEVIFRKFNLMEPVFPFKKKFHVIFCRNVMIYFDEKTKNSLVKKFADSLLPGGYLFIGHSESLNREESGLKYIMPAVYRKL